MVEQELIAVFVPFGVVIVIEVVVLVALDIWNRLVLRARRRRARVRMHETSSTTELFHPDIQDTEDSGPEYETIPDLMCFQMDHMTLESGAAAVSTEHANTGRSHVGAGASATPTRGGVSLDGDILQSHATSIEDIAAYATTTLCTGGDNEGLTTSRLGGPRVMQKSIPTVTDDYEYATISGNEDRNASFPRPRVSTLASSIPTEDNVAYVTTAMPTGNPESTASIPHVTPARGIPTEENIAYATTTMPTGSTGTSTPHVTPARPIPTEDTTAYATIGNAMPSGDAERNNVTPARVIPTEDNVM